MISNDTLKNIIEEIETIESRINEIYFIEQFEKAEEFNKRLSKVKEMLKPQRVDEKHLTGLSVEIQNIIKEIVSLDFDINLYFKENGENLKNKQFEKKYRGEVEEIFQDDTTKTSEELYSDLAEVIKGWNQKEHNEFIQKEANSKIAWTILKIIEIQAKRGEQIDLARVEDFCSYEELIKVIKAKLIERAKIQREENKIKDFKEENKAEDSKKEKKAKDSKKGKKAEDSKKEKKAKDSKKGKKVKDSKKRNRAKDFQKENRAKDFQKENRAKDSKKEVQEVLEIAEKLEPEDLENPLLWRIITGESEINLLGNTKRKVTEQTNEEITDSIQVETEIKKENFWENLKSSIVAYWKKEEKREEPAKRQREEPPKRQNVEKKVGDNEIKVTHLTYEQCFGENKLDMFKIEPELLKANRVFTWRK